MAADADLSLSPMLIRPNWFARERTFCWLVEQGAALQAEIEKIDWARSI